MTLAERLDQFLVGKIAFPAINYVLNRHNPLGRYRKLLLTERCSKDALKERQFQKLQELLRHTNFWSPFYATRFKKAGIVPEDIRSLEDFKRVPPLERDELIECRLELLDKRYQNAARIADLASSSARMPRPFVALQKYRLIRNASTGSTGAPTIFYEDGSTTALNWANELRLKHWFGVSPGAKEARMKGSSTSYASRSNLRMAREFLWNQMILPGIFLSDREFELCSAKIRKYRPRVLWGPTPGLVGLARFVQRQKFDISADLVISWAAPLYEHEKNLLKEVFGCPVTNIYGSREVGHIAMACPHGSMHINEEDYLVELDHGGSGKTSVSSQLLITPLNPSPMSFLRYRIGDLAQFEDAACPCGRSTSVLHRIVGRIGEVFYTQDGRTIEPNFWCLVFTVDRQSRDVERFQVIYQRSDCIRFRIVPRPSYNAETEAALRRLLRDSFPSSMRFEFEYISNIEPQPSGKFQMVVNKIAQPDENPASVPNLTIVP
jgi:phenylacetate-CoA ligase